MMAQYLDIFLVLIALAWAVWTMARAFGLGQKSKAVPCANCPVRPRAAPLKPAAAASNWAKK